MAYKKTYFEVINYVSFDNKGTLLFECNDFTVIEVANLWYFYVKDWRVMSEVNFKKHFEENYGNSFEAYFTTLQHNEDLRLTNFKRQEEELKKAIELLEDIWTNKN